MPLSWNDIRTSLERPATLFASISDRRKSRAPGVMRVQRAVLLTCLLVSCSHRVGEAPPAPSVERSSPLFAALLSRDRNQVYLLDRVLEYTEGGHAECGFDFSSSYTENVPAILYTLELFLQMDPTRFRYLEREYETASRAFTPVFLDGYWE